MSGEDEKNSSSTQTPTANTSTYVPGRVGIVGLGLMGGSFAKAFAKGGREVYAWNRTHATVELAMVETIQGELTPDVVPTCELIILCGYPEVCVQWLEDMQDLISLLVPLLLIPQVLNAVFVTNASLLQLINLGPLLDVTPWLARNIQDLVMLVPICFTMRPWLLCHHQ